MSSIGHFSLDNGSGMYVCALDIVWWDSTGAKHSVTDAAKDIALGQCKSADPGQHGVPDGSKVALRLNVKSAQQKDITASETFTYQSGNVTYANYTASGTTFSPGLDLINVGANYCAQKASKATEKMATAGR